MSHDFLIMKPAGVILSPQDLREEMLALAQFIDAGTLRRIMAR